MHRSIGPACTCSDLMSEATTAAVYHDTDLPLVLNAHLPSIELVVDLIYHLDLCIVVPCS